MEKLALTELYVQHKLSVQQIAKKFDCSAGKVNYWLHRYRIPKRSIGEALYAHHNPNGDPFTIKTITTNHQHFLLGLGLGLYWGEGTKRDRGSVRLGNTDPFLIKSFIIFMQKCYAIDKHKLHFGLQIFRDMDVEKELEFWVSFLQVSRKQFYKTIVTASRAAGTYREKTAHGVLTVYFHNTKLRSHILSEIEKMRREG